MHTLTRTGQGFEITCPDCSKNRTVLWKPKNWQTHICRSCSAGKPDKKSKPKVVLSNDQINRYVRGTTAMCIAEESGVSASVVGLALRRQGVQVRNRSEVAKQTDHTGLFAGAAAMLATGELPKRISAGHQGVSREDWKGFTSSRATRIHYWKQWKAWREKVLRRDGYCCKMCGVTRNEDVQIDTHHIKPRCRYPQGTYDVDNGISLCKSCHESIRGKESEFETQLLNAIKQ